MHLEILRTCSLCSGESSCSLPRFRTTAHKGGRQGNAVTYVLGCVGVRSRGNYRSSRNQYGLCPRDAHVGQTQTRVCRDEGAGKRAPLAVVRTRRDFWCTGPACQRPDQPRAGLVGWANWDVRRGRVKGLSPRTVLFSLFFSFPVFFLFQISFSIFQI